MFNCIGSLALVEKSVVLHMTSPEQLCSLQLQIPLFAVKVPFSSGLKLLSSLFDHQALSRDILRLFIVIFMLPFEIL
jgi:hypothetical protein